MELPGRGLTRIGLDITYRDFSDLVLVFIWHQILPNVMITHKDLTMLGHAMLICKVALGKSYVLTHNQASLMTVPSGYDSVYGKNSPEGALNYDEVVYCIDAVLPTHIIVYERDGTGKIVK